ncbi:SRPBCC domain-containing protein [Streptomyces sp. NBC_01476]|uniref:SRPBCC domain-containing protein n=1 Tax=Streptomyces sp. NBC_01476 TaxID=2903881 RepID=UPI002E37ED9F|nr:SRPBCC domain-containing protein [Streptomyces sp. NBC_01476]
MTEDRDRAPQQAHGTPPELPPEQAHDGVRHDTFTVTLRLSVPPAEVFRAFADPGLRRRWFKLPGTGATYEHDFRVGGGETAFSTFATPDAPPQRLAYWSRYIDITPDVRIVYVYASQVDGVVRWASLATVELHAGSAGTELSWTEQVTFVTPTGDGRDDLPHVRGGTRLRLNGLAAALASPETPRTTTPHPGGRNQLP